MTDDDAKQAEPEFLPDEPDDPAVFDREDGAEPGDKAGILCVTQEARRHWSDKNPKKFTPETALKIITYLGGSGCCLETAAAAAGLNKTTLHDWLRRSERARGDDKCTAELRAWKAQLDEVEATTELRAAQGIMSAGDTDWKAWAWFLERRYPKRWGRRDTAIHENPDGTPLAMTPQQITIYRLPDNGRDPDPAKPDGT